MSRRISAASAQRRVARLSGLLLLVASVVAPALPARAIEFGDGLVEIHGAYQMNLRALSSNFKTKNFYLSQWAHSLTIEAEADLAPDGFGPFDLVQAFVRAQVRFDCVWYSACWTAPAATLFGKRANRAPAGNLADGTDPGFNGLLPNPATGAVRLLGEGDRLVGFESIPPLDALLTIGGASTLDSLNATIAGINEHRFSLKAFQGSIAPGTFVLPFVATTEIDANGANTATATGQGLVVPISRVASPLSGNCLVLDCEQTATPVLDMSDPDDFAMTGFGLVEGGLRPATSSLNTPSARFLERNGDFDSYDQNYSQLDFALNRGQSQSQTKELKEAYFDLELLDSSLFLRIGLQTIVWGKTELFRAQDQFNPQDLALANLPSLEDSRIPLWAIRAIYSFYSVGPLEDVRLEVAVNFDEQEAVDFGRCGEPYTIFLACGKTFGLIAHGFLNVGLAGEDKPPDPWDGIRGVEFGARLEFRWSRFSFAITDFYGFNDFPTANLFNVYERNVDPTTGRPREAGARGPCTTGAEDACLTPDELAADLSKHPGNRQFFDVICSASAGIVSNSLGQLLAPDPNDPSTFLFPNACALDIFNDTTPIASVLGLTIPQILSFGMTDSDTLGFSFWNAIARPALGPLLAGDDVIPPNLELWDGDRDIDLDGDSDAADDAAIATFAGLSRSISREQQALLGCGELYFQSDGTAYAGVAPNGGACHNIGVDLFNLEPSVIFSAFPQVEQQALDQTGLPHSAIATRFVDGQIITLPGARGLLPDGTIDPSYDPLVDGCFTDDTVLAAAGFTGDASPCVGAPDYTDPAVIEAALDAQVGATVALLPVIEALVAGYPNGFTSEMQVLSFNLLSLFAGLSPALDENDPDEGCLNPDFIGTPDFLLQCTLVRAFVSAAGVARPEIRAGGNGRYGRRDFVWLSGGEVELFYQKRNVFGFAMDFAEDITKSNWGLEFTWFQRQPFANTRNEEGFDLADQLTLTISIDRPTFINFLNANRTFFFNTQWFLRYIPQYEGGETFTANGPVNVLGTFTFFTGFYQDRLLMASTFVHDFNSRSGGQIFSLTYRVSEVFSVSVGIQNFYGNPENIRIPFAQASQSPFAGADYRNRNNFQGVSPIAERDEINFALRYTF